jgi:hypothetical protein
MIIKNIAKNRPLQVRGCGSFNHVEGGVFIDSRKTVYVYDINLEKKQASCLTDIWRNGYSSLKKEKVKLCDLRDYIKKDKKEMDFVEVVGVAFKKDGSIKLKPKELEPYAMYHHIRKSVPKWEKHIKHMKAVKKQLKEEQEREEDFDYDER